MNWNGRGGGERGAGGRKKIKGLGVRCEEQDYEGQGGSGLRGGAGGRVDLCLSLVTFLPLKAEQRLYGHFRVVAGGLHGSLENFADNFHFPTGPITDT